MISHYIKIAIINIMLLVVSSYYIYNLIQTNLDSVIAQKRQIIQKLTKKLSTLTSITNKKNDKKFSIKQQYRRINNYAQALNLSFTNINKTSNGIRVVITGNSIVLIAFINRLLTNNEQIKFEKINIKQDKASVQGVIYD